jgi:maltokinase
VLRSVDHPGPAMRVHGDYHLGQVMRTDGGWYVLDFEGEPARPLDERLRPTSALKDVAGMLRSLTYAAWFVLGERNGEDTAWLEPMARAWEHRNRQAFLRGYYDHKGIDSLLPVAPKDREAVRLAFELEKAVYELAYEEAHRPSWARIPLVALRRLLLSPVEELLSEGSEHPPPEVAKPDL